MTACLGLLVACTSTPYVPVEAQVSYPGRITEKEKLINPNQKEELDRAEANYDTGLLLIAMGGIIGGTIGGPMITSGHVSGEPYRYTIRTEDEEIAVVVTAYGGFTLGDCVAVLVGKESGKVSMAYGAECKGTR